jgi:hypothetical protein
MSEFGDLGFGHYILEGHTPKRVDAPTWSRWYRQAHESRRVGWTEIGKCIVSTRLLEHQSQLGRPGAAAPLRDHDQA